MFPLPNQLCCSCQAVAPAVLSYYAFVTVRNYDCDHSTWEYGRCKHLGKLDTGRHSPHRIGPFVPSWLRNHLQRLLPPWRVGLTFILCQVLVLTAGKEDLLYISGHLHGARACMHA